MEHLPKPNQTGYENLSAPMRRHPHPRRGQAKGSAAGQKQEDLILSSGLGEARRAGEGTGARATGDVD
eukprot:5614365-Pyramimonas_sp.AAC.1